MSRCFSFPPPGYLRNTDTLIEESIKIQLDTEKPIKGRKEKKDKKNRNETKEERKLRKDKKKERKEKRKREEEQAKKDSKLKLTNEVTEPKDNGKLQKGEYYENEYFEKSDITEELCKPVSSPQEPYSSDSSQSSKRKRDTLLPSKDQGTGFRIRLPLRKHRESEEVKQGFKLGSSSRSVGISDSIIQETKRVQLPLKNVETPNKLVGTSASQNCRPIMKKVEAHSSSQGFRPPPRRVGTLLPGNSASRVCRPPVKKVETLFPGTSASQVCRPPLKKVEALLPGTSASQVCRPLLKKVETLLPGTSASQVCRPPLKKVETLLPGTSASQVCRPPLKKVETLLPGNSASQVCRPPLKKVETLPLENSASREEATPNQHPVSSTSKVCRPPLSKDQSPSQLNVNSCSKVCRPPLQKDETRSLLEVSKPLNSLDPPSKPLKNKTVDKESLRMESLYNSLLKIPPVTYYFDSMDQDWLFSSALTEAKPVSKKQKIDDAIQCSKSLWPSRAQYMPEVEMYALPYTVPF
ncbi:unnamed protein product [Lathyrus sativus]|nr:unnamed protein product [Lathyrus sativus]